MTGFFRPHPSRKWIEREEETQGEEGTEGTQGGEETQGELVIWRLLSNRGSNSGIHRRKGTWLYLGDGCEQVGRLPLAISKDPR